MPERIFKFKQFSVSHSQSAMKIGTDAVLLGAWAELPDDGYFLDIGCGSGIISLMLAQRSTNIITAVEIDPLAYQEAVLNVINSKFKNQINVILGDIKTLNLEKKYSLIICNPPFYKGANSPEHNRNIARHDNNLNPYDLFYIANKLLHENALFYIIYPFYRRDEILNTAIQFSLNCIKELHISPQKNKETNRCIFCFSRKNIKCTISKIYIENSLRHNYSKKYINLTSDYYLKF